MYAREREVFQKQWQSDYCSKTFADAEGKDKNKKKKKRRLFTAIQTDMTKEKKDGIITTGSAQMSRITLKRSLSIVQVEDARIDKLLLFLFSSLLKHVLLQRALSTSQSTHKVSCINPKDQFKLKMCTSNVLSLWINWTKLNDSLQMLQVLMNWGLFHRTKLLTMMTRLAAGSDRPFVRWYSALPWQSVCESNEFYSWFADTKTRRRVGERGRQTTRKDWRKGSVQSKQKAHTRCSSILKSCPRIRFSSSSPRLDWSKFASQKASLPLSNVEADIRPRSNKCNALLSSLIIRFVFFVDQFLVSRTLTNWKNTSEKRGREKNFNEVSFPNFLHNNPSVSWSRVTGEKCDRQAEIVLFLSLPWVFPRSSSSSSSSFPRRLRRWRQQAMSAAVPKQQAILLPEREMELFLYDPTFEEDENFVQIRPTIIFH